MPSLVLKDILIQKKMLRFSVVYSIFILIAFNSPAFAAMAYVMGAMASTYMLLQGACAYESKGKGEMILNSFPIRRVDVVRARYLSVFVFMIFSLVIIGSLGAGMKLLGAPFPHSYLGWSDVVAVLITLLILSSFYLPLYFKFGYIRSRVFNVLMFLVIFFAPVVLLEYYQENGDKRIIQQLQAFLAHKPDWLISFFVIMLFLILLYGSYRFAVLIYQRREF